MRHPLRWGILGTGSIAAIFARDLPHSTTGELAAVASRTLDKAQAFAAEHAPHANAHGSYDDLLADPDVDAVYISAPHTEHRDWTIAAAKAGKHILCEKPIALTARDAEDMIDAARTHDVFLMEAFMYRCHPQTAVLRDLLANDAIGRPRFLTASFGFAAHFDPQHRLFNPALGGGGILDIGCYTASMAVLVGGPGHPHVTGTGRLGATNVDEWAAASLRYDDGLVAQLSCAVGVELDNAVRVFGTHGTVTLRHPWHGGPVVLHRKNSEPEHIEAPADRGLYALEADEVARSVDDRQSTAMPWADTLAVMRILDDWRAAVGVVYPAEDR